MDYRRTSPQQGSREFFITIHDPARPASSALVVCIDSTFHCIQDYVQLDRTGQGTRCAVLDKSAQGKHSLFVASVEFEETSRKHYPQHKTRERVYLVADTEPATSLELSKDKKRLYLLDSLQERAEVRCTTSWQLLATGPIRMD